MGARLLVDNVFNPRIYPAHTLSSNENSTDTPLVAAGRRSVYDGWTSATLNADAWNKSRADTPRLADMIVVDHPHNLMTKIVKAQVCDDDFAGTPQDAFNGAVPSVSAAGLLTDAFGVLTPDGAWLKRFDQRGGYDWRAYFVAMGAGLKPLVPGLWIGLSYSPGDPWRPHTPQGMSELIVTETESDAGWLGRGKVARRRQGTMLFKFSTLDDAEQADWHLQRISEGHPFWLIGDEERAEMAVLAILPKGLIGTVMEPNYFYPALTLPWQEVDPLEIT
jgi:hypothetical protein